jgi:hypothetical protein
MRARREEQWELIKNQAVREFYDKLVKDIADEYNFVNTEHLEQADSEGRTSFHFVVAKSYRAISRIPELVDLMLNHYHVSSSRFAISEINPPVTLDYKKATAEESESGSNENALVENEEDEQSPLNRMISLGVTPLDIAVALRDHGMVLKMLDSPSMNNPSKYNSNQIAIRRAFLALQLNSSETSKLLSFILGREVSDYSRDADPNVKNEIKNSLSSKLIELFPFRDKYIIIKDENSDISDLSSDDSEIEDVNPVESKLPSPESPRVIEKQPERERSATPARPRSASILPRCNTKEREDAKTTGQSSIFSRAAIQLATGEEVRPTRSYSAARRRQELPNTQGKDGKKKLPVMRF